LRERRGKDCNVTETIAADRIVWTRPRTIGLVVLIALVSFILGVGIGNRGVTALQNTNKNLQKEKEKLTAEKIELQKESYDLKTALKSAQDKVAAFLSNVYEIKPRVI
jgi:cell division protein FtsB